MPGGRRQLRRYSISRCLEETGPKKRGFKALQWHRPSWIPQDKHMPMGIRHTERDLWRRNGRTNGRDTLCNNPFFARIILIIYYVCLYVLVCDYLSLYVFYSELVNFGFRRVF